MQKAKLRVRVSWAPTLEILRQWFLMRPGVCLFTSTLCESNVGSPRSTLRDIVFRVNGHRRTYFITCDQRKLAAFLPTGREEFTAWLVFLETA